MYPTADPLENHHRSREPLGLRSLGTDTSVLRKSLGVAAVLSAAIATASPGQLEPDRSNRHHASAHGAEFGHTLASGDFDGDGIDEVVVGVPGLNQVEVRYLPSNPGAFGSFTLSVPSAGRFGHSLAVCDFNSDDFDDLVVGAPFTHVDGVVAAGRVYVYSGGPIGLNFEFSLDDSLPGIGDQPEPIDLFGRAVATGYFDHRCDLAVGVPGKDVSGLDQAGVVRLFRINSAFTVTHLRDFDSTTLGGTVNEGAAFGYSFAVGDFDGSDSFRQDLAVGAPYQTVDGLQHAGQVDIFFNNGSTLSGALGQILTEESLNTATPDNFFFGAALASGDFDSDEFDDLAIGSPYGPLSSSDTTPAGVVYVVRGEDAPQLSDVEIWSQNETGGAGDAQADERFGWAIAAGNFDGDRYDDLAIGSTAEDGNDGRVDVVYGARTGLDSASVQLIYEDQLHMGFASDESFGEALVAGEFAATGADGLAVGVPKKDVNGYSNNGVTYVMQSAAQLVRTTRHFSEGEIVFFDDTPRTIRSIDPPARDENGRAGLKLDFLDDEVALLTSTDGATWTMLYDSAPFPDVSSFSPQLTFSFDAGDRFAFAGASIPSRGFNIEFLYFRDEGGELARGRDPIPGDPAQEIRDFRSAQLAATEDYFFVRTNSNHVLKEGAGGLEVVIDPATWIAGTAMTRLLDYSVSRDATRLAALGLVSSTRIAAVNGVEVAREGDSVLRSGATTPEGTGLLWETLSLIDVDGPDILLGGTLVAGTSQFGYLESSAGSSINAEFATIEGQSLHSWSPRKVATSPAGAAAVLWLSNEQGRGLLAQSCGRHLPNARAVVEVGDRIDWSGQGHGGVLTSIDGFEHLGRSLLVKAAVDSGTDSQVALLEFASRCPLFADGYESGDTSAWSSSTP